MSSISYAYRPQPPNVRPDFPAYSVRQHWAIEAMLGLPEFEYLQWTFLQPDIFKPISLAPAIAFIKHYHKDGKQSTFCLDSDENAPVGLVHPDDVGRFATVLLSEEGHSVHNKAKYVLNGPKRYYGKVDCCHGGRTHWNEKLKR